MSYCSIIMPSFNPGPWIIDSVQSVIAQTFEDWELVIADGGSSRGGQELLDQIEPLDTRIRIIRNEKDNGPAHARTIAIQSSASDYVAFLDSDDVWDKTKLAQQLKFMKVRNIAFSFTDVRTINGDGNLSKTSLTSADSHNFKQYLRRRGIANSSVVIDRRLLTPEILESEYNGLGEDTLWWLLIMRGGVSAHLLPEPLLHYRITDESRSSQSIKNQMQVWRMYRTELNISFTLTLGAYVRYVFDVACRRIRFSIQELFS